jgi:hypothetical protein
MTDITAYEGWALVEQMGFRKTVGKVVEVEQFGTKMLRLDIPSFGTRFPAVPGGDGDVVIAWSTRFCGGPSIYQVTPLAEDVALEMAKHQADPRPVHPAAYRQLEPPQQQATANDSNADELPF